MAAIAATDVTVVQSWFEQIPGRTLLHRIVDIALNGNGGTADDIPASYCGFKELWEANSLLYTIGGPAYKCVPVVIEADKAGILTINLTDATDATRYAIANVPAAGTLRVKLTGLENN